MTDVELIRKTLMKTRDVKCNGCRNGRRIYWEHNVRWHFSDTGTGSICFGSFERSLLELPDHKLLKAVENQEWPHPTHLERYKELLDRMGVPYEETISGETISIDVEQLPAACPIKWSGYGGFGFSFTFDANTGKLLSVGAWE